MGERYERREVRDGVFEDFLLKSKIRERTAGANITIIIITITSVEFFILLLCVITIILLLLLLLLLLDTLLALLL